MRYLLLGLLQRGLKLELLLELQLLSLELLLLLLLLESWLLYVELLGDLRDSDEGQGYSHGLAGNTDAPTGGCRTGLHSRQGLRLYPPELGGGPVSSGGGGDQGPGHRHRHWGHHGLGCEGRHQAGVQHWQAGPWLSRLSVLLLLALE